MSTERYTWKKGKERDGRMRLPKTYSLRCEGRHIATAQMDPNTGLWFWYGQGHNTAAQPDTLEGVKAHALKTLKQ